MNAADEKSNTLSRCGSFYYNTLVDASKDDAEFVAHSTWQTRALDQLQCVTDAVAGNCYTKGHFKLIHFTDKDINWRGMKAALQVRTNVPAVEPPMPPVLDYNNRYADYHLGTGTLLETDTQEVLADEDAQAILSPAATEATLPGTTELVWDLAVSPELLVTSIAHDGTLLLMGQDYIAQYGKLTFFENPVHMFPAMKFMAQSYMQRRQSIYSHMLRLGQMYTFPDRVLHYYRVAQTPRTLYLAAAQACGMAVVREDCVIRDVVPFLDGYAYETSSGRYDAPYEHTPLVAGTNLKEGTVIGGDELFVLCGPGDRLPGTVNALNLDNAVPVPGLKVPKGEMVVYDAHAYYRPGYLGTAAAQQAFYDYLSHFNTPIEGEVDNITRTYVPANPSENFTTQLQQAVTQLHYTPGESYMMMFTVTSYSGSGTAALIEFAPDYYLITQGGSYIGLSASKNSMRTNLNTDPGWPAPTSTETNWGIATNEFSSNGLLYGWISRNAAGASGAANVLPLRGMYVTISYDESTNTTEIQLANEGGTLQEIIILRNVCLSFSDFKFTSFSGSMTRISSTNSRTAPVTVPDGIDYFRNVACGGRCITVCINEAKLPRCMQLRLNEFIIRELPAGSVLTTASLGQPTSTAQEALAPVALIDTEDSPSHSIYTVPVAAVEQKQCRAFVISLYATEYVASDVSKGEPETVEIANIKVDLSERSLSAADSTRLAVYNYTTGELKAISAPLTAFNELAGTYEFATGTLLNTAELYMCVFIAANASQEDLQSLAADTTSHYKSTLSIQLEVQALPVASSDGGIVISQNFEALEHAYYPLVTVTGNKAVYN